MIRPRRCRRAVLEQFGDIFRVTCTETGLVREFENPIAAKRMYDEYLTDDRSYGTEIEMDGYNRYTGEKIKRGFCS